MNVFGSKDKGQGSTGTASKIINGGNITGAVEENLGLMDRLEADGTERTFGALEEAIGGELFNYVGGVDSKNETVYLVDDPDMAQGANEASSLTDKVYSFGKKLSHTYRGIDGFEVQSHTINRSTDDVVAGIIDDLTPDGRPEGLSEPQVTPSSDGAISTSRPEPGGVHTLGDLNEELDVDVERYVEQIDHEAEAVYMVSDPVKSPYDDSGITGKLSSIGRKAKRTLGGNDIQDYEIRSNSLAETGDDVVQSIMQREGPLEAESGSSYEEDDGGLFGL